MPQASKTAGQHVAASNASSTGPALAAAAVPAPLPSKSLPIEPLAELHAAASLLRMCVALLRATPGDDDSPDLVAIDTRATLGEVAACVERLAENNRLRPLPHMAPWHGRELRTIASLARACSARLSEPCAEGEAQEVQRLDVLIGLRLLSARVGAGLLEVEDDRDELAPMAISTEACQ